MTSQKELIPMRPGDILRYEREQKRLTLERAAEESRIKPSVLSAIESGETGDIPSVYLRGHIRHYANYLGLDPAELEQHMENVQGATPEVRTVFSVKTSRGHSERWLKASSYLAASVLIAALAWQFTHEAVRFSQGESGLKSAENGVAGIPNVADNTAHGQGSRPANTHLSASIASVEVLRERAEQGGSSAGEQAWAAVADPAAPVQAGPGQHRVSITTSADTWVEIFGADDRQLEMDLIRAGNSRSYDGTGPFRIMIGRASAVELFIDGEPVDLGPHTRGNVAHLTLAEAPQE